jgi:hypothetical protein
MQDQQSGPGIGQRLSLARSKAISIGIAAITFTVVDLAVLIIAVRMQAEPLVPGLFGVSAVLGLWCVLTVRSFVTALTDQELRIQADLSMQDGALAGFPVLELLSSGRRRYFTVFMAHLLTGDLAILLWIILQVGGPGSGNG